MTGSFYAHGRVYHVVQALFQVETALEWHSAWHGFWHSAALGGDTPLALNGTVYDTVVIVMYNLKFKFYLLTRMSLSGKIH